jgi:hypothetical protein
MPTGVYKRIKPDWKKGRTDIVSNETKEKIRQARLGKEYCLNMILRSY